MTPLRLSVAAPFLLVSSAIAVKSQINAGDAKKISASSPAASKLINQSSRARNLDGYYDDITWMADYSLQFVGCHSVVQYAEEGGGGDEALTKLYTQNLVRYRLCKECNTDCEGEYLVDMGIFVDAYTEYQMDAAEYACEYTRENCNCQYANDDDVCENQCYVDAGQDYCVENENEYEEEFEVQRYLECEEMEIQYNNNYYNNNNDGGNAYNQNGELQFFIGPKCSSDGKKVNLAVYYDEMCSIPAPEGTYTKYNYYGKDLPYAQDSLVEFNCISCEERDEDAQQNYNGYQQDNNREITDMCEETYEESAKCESGMDKSYPRTIDCDYIQNTVYKQDANGSSGDGSAVGFAWLFGISTVLLVGYAYHLKKSQQPTMKLSEQGAMA